MSLVGILKAIIVDDEEKAITNLRNLIDSYCPSIKVIDVAFNVDVAAVMINARKPDVVFLDIAMPGKNGFELLQFLTYMPLIVFVTAYERYALNAIKAAAVDYILKPISIDDLRDAEEKLLRITALKGEISLDNYNVTVSTLLQLLHKPGIIRHITIPDSRGYNILDTAEILYLEGESNYTTFYLHGKQKIVVPKTLKEYEDILAESGFARIHKSSIVNMCRIKSIKRTESVDVMLDNGQTLPVSRRRAVEFLKKAKHYVADV